MKYLTNNGMKTFDTELNQMFKLIFPTSFYLMWLLESLTLHIWLVFVINVKRYCISIG